MPKPVKQPRASVLLRMEKEAHNDTKLKLDRETRVARATSAELRALLKSMHSRNAELEKEIDAYAHSVKSRRAPSKIRPTSGSGTSESVALVLMSDWHIDEIVPKETVQGLNEYRPEIAEKRARAFFDHLLRVVDMNRKHTRIDTLVAWCGGDFITGHIHEEMKETTAMTPLESVDFAAQLLRAGFEFLLEHGGFKRIVVPCSFGNHGRLTRKPYTTKAAEHNLEWFMYIQLQRQFASSPELEFHVTRSRLHDSVVVFDRRLRFHHGEDLKFQGGQQGVYGRLHKSHQAWNQTNPCYMTCVGHWHQAIAFQDLGMQNGSLIGYSAYAQLLQAQFEPPRQMMCLIEKDYGMVASYPIFVD